MSMVVMARLQSNDNISKFCMLIVSGHYLKSLRRLDSNCSWLPLLQSISLSPQNPPNFLRASALSEHISPVVVIPVESSSPESEHVVETEDLVDTDIPPLPVPQSHCPKLSCILSLNLSI